MHLPPPLSLPCGGPGVLRVFGAGCGAMAGIVVAVWLSALWGLGSGLTIAVASSAAALCAWGVGLATRTTRGQLVWDGQGQWHLSPWPDGEARPVSPSWAMDAGSAILLALHEHAPGRRKSFRRRTWTIVQRGMADSRRWARVRACLAWQRTLEPGDRASWAP